MANLAGVSKATVSRVINENPTVSERNLKRVRHAMEELDYRPRKNRPGPKPRLQFKPGMQTGNVGLIVVGRTLELIQHPLYSQLLASIGTALRLEGLHLVLDEMLTP